MKRAAIRLFLYRNLVIESVPKNTYRINNATPEIKKLFKNKIDNLSWGDVMQLIPDYMDAPETSIWQKIKKFLLTRRVKNS